jgi:predicted nucleic acid-binding protein
MDGLGESGRVLVTSDSILDETVTRLRIQGDYRIATAAWDALEHDLGSRIVQVSAEDRRKAREWFRKLSGIPVSLTDCTSFALMARLGIKEAATFDTDFRKAGFRTLPG